MTEQPPESKHALLKQVAFIAAWYAIRHYAAAYLVRTAQDPDAGRRFLRRMDLRLVAGMILFAAVFALSCVVSYASLRLSFFVALCGLIGALATFVPSHVRMVRYALAEKEWRRKTRGPLSSRAYQTAQDYFPTMFQ
jgi:hypothetical protein